MSNRCSQVMLQYKISQSIEAQMNQQSKNKQNTYYNIDLMCLQSQCLSDDDIILIFDCIKDKHKVVSLKINLENNNIGIIGVKNIMTNLKLFHNLFSFHILLSNNTIYDEGLEILMNGISGCTLLENLSIFISNNKITSKGIKYIEQIRCLPQLQKLTLAFSRNALGINLVNSLCVFITQLKDLNELTLMMQESEIGNIGIQSLSKYFKSLKRLNSLSLFIDQNQITDNGALNLMKNISEMKQLQNLTIDLCHEKITEYNYIEYQGYANVLSESGVYKMIQNLSKLQLNSIEIKIKYYSNYSYKNYQKYGYESLINDLIFNEFQKLQMNASIHAQQKNIIF